MDKKRIFFLICLHLKEVESIIHFCIINHYYQKDITECVPEADS